MSEDNSTTGDRDKDKVEEQSDGICTKQEYGKCGHSYKKSIYWRTDNLVQFWKHHCINNDHCYRYNKKESFWWSFQDFHVG
jgi:hypothetical protein